MKKYILVKIESCFLTFILKFVIILTLNLSTANPKRLAVLYIIS